jgi:hypothetical protein
MSEDDFWKCTPRKLNALFEKHLELNGHEEEKETHIDDIIF